MALQVQTGAVWVNKFFDMPFDVPFGGSQQSGFGGAQGAEGMQESTQATIINIAKEHTVPA